MGEGGSAEGGGEDKKVLGWVGQQEDEMSLRTHPKTNRRKLGTRSRNSAPQPRPQPETTHCQQDNNHQSWTAEDEELEGLLHSFEQQWGWHEAVVKVDLRETSDRSEETEVGAGPGAVEERSKRRNKGGEENVESTRNSAREGEGNEGAHPVAREAKKDEGEEGTRGEEKGQETTRETEEGQGANTARESLSQEHSEDHSDKEQDNQ